MQSHPNALAGTPQTRFVAYSTDSSAALPADAAYLHSLTLPATGSGILVVPLQSANRHRLKFYGEGSALTTAVFKAWVLDEVQTKGGKTEYFGSLVIGSGSLVLGTGQLNGESEIESTKATRRFVDSVSILTADDLSLNKITIFHNRSGLSPDLMIDLVGGSHLVLAFQITGATRIGVAIKAL